MAVIAAFLLGLTVLIECSDANRIQRINRLSEGQLITWPGDPNSRLTIYSPFAGGFLSVKNDQLAVTKGRNNDTSFWRAEFNGISRRGVRRFVHLPYTVSSNTNTLRKQLVETNGVLQVKSVVNSGAATFVVTRCQREFTTVRLMLVSNNSHVTNTFLSVSYNDRLEPEFRFVADPKSGNVRNQTGTTMNPFRKPETEFILTLY